MALNWMLLNTHMNANIHLVMNSFVTLFHDKIFSLTFPWLLTTSLTFPWHVPNSLTFPGFPDKWSPCIKLANCNSFKPAPVLPHFQINLVWFIYLILHYPVLLLLFVLWKAVDWLTGKIWPEKTCSTNSHFILGMWKSVPEYLRDPECSADTYGQLLKTCLFSQY